MSDEKVNADELWGKLDEVFERLVEAHIFSDPRLEDIVQYILVVPLYVAEAAHQGLSAPPDPAEFQRILNEQMEKLFSEGLDPFAPAFVVLLLEALPEGVVFPQDIEGIRIYAELATPNKDKNCAQECDNCANEDCCADGGCEGRCRCDHHETNPT